MALRNAEAGPLAFCLQGCFGWRPELRTEMGGAGFEGRQTPPPHGKTHPIAFTLTLTWALRSTKSSAGLAADALGFSKGGQAIFAGTC